MDKEIQQLVEMGATAAQARAALKKHKDVMQAAERIFDGHFDDVREDEEMADAAQASVPPPRATSRKMPTPDVDEDDEDEEMVEDGDDEDEFIDYDSDAEDDQPAIADIDPYAGIFFSKDRREEVIEVEEEPETILDSESNERVKLMTQGEWMKGCPEGSEQSFLFGLYSELSQGKCTCPNCGKHLVVRRKRDFFTLYPEFSTYVRQLGKVVERECPQCKKEFCLACGEPVSADKPANYSPLFHCANMQGALLGVGLAMVERMLAEQNQDAAREDGQSNKRRKTDLSATPQDSDDGLDNPPTASKKAKKQKAKGGIGYAGDLKEDNRGQLQALANQKAKDEKMGNLLSELRTYLPTLKREGSIQSSDYLVHPTTLAHLRRRFNHVCSSFLRNDSLADMSERSVLYLELFQWLETISNHEALASLMAQPIMTVSSVKAVATKKGSGNTHLRERTIIYEGSSGPRELLESIVIQATAALKGLEGLRPLESPAEEMTEMQKRVTDEGKGKGKAVEESTPSQENAHMLDFCRRILYTAKAIDRFLSETKGASFVERLHASLPRIATSSDAAVYLDSDASEESVKAAYMKWGMQARFEYCDLTLPPAANSDANDDQTPHYKFYFNNEARLLASSDIPKRSLAIAKELAVLTTNLPVAWDSSVFLRVDESRVDVIKALITGPEGTPYHNGCYLFDIFLGANYNQQPPSVKYMTTNGGKYRFNPNLYADGKVCLSLLGTWQGPGWVSGKSTLLQVLISIQSMILCEEPYLNEPGWADSAGTPQSKAYSANVRRMVVKSAMLGNLKTPPEPFGDIIRTHYRLKSKSITAQLDRWLAQDDGRPTMGDGAGAYGQTQKAGGSSSELRKDVNELKQLLKRLQDGEDIDIAAA